jgi:hypothetical protein
LDKKHTEKILSKLKILSNFLENEDLSDFDLKMTSYGKKADFYQRMYRRKGHRFFLQNVVKYPPRILYRQIRTFVNNRISDIMINYDSHRA